MLTPSAVDTIRTALKNSREMETDVACLDADDPRVVAIDKAATELDNLAAMQGGAWLPLTHKIALGFGHESIVCDATSIGGLPLPDDVRIMQRYTPAQPQPLDATPKPDVFDVFASDVQTAKVPGLGLVDFVRWDTVVDKWEEFNGQTAQPLDAPDLRYPLDIPNAAGDWVNKLDEGHAIFTLIEIDGQLIHVMDDGNEEIVTDEDDMWYGNWWPLTMPWEGREGE